jgi:hypothetical protein
MSNGVNALVVGEREMNVKEFAGTYDMINSEVELHGWLVDTEDGLFLWDYHKPRDYDHPRRIKNTVSSGNCHVWPQPADEPQQDPRPDHSNCFEAVIVLPAFFVASRFL